jgi:putative endonuclease
MAQKIIQAYYGTVVNMLSSSFTGKAAEELVASYLKRNKHKIIEMNWRTRWCEIDIISRTKTCVFFTEVKYRSSDAWGEGMNYITDKKLKQMKFAAEMWLHDSNWKFDATLQAASVDHKNDIEIIELYT